MQLSEAEACHAQQQQLQQQLDTMEQQPLAGAGAACPQAAAAAAAAAVTAAAAAAQTPARCDSEAMCEGSHKPPSHLCALDLSCLTALLE